MKKLLCFIMCLTAILTLTAGTSCADGPDPVLHVFIENIERITGGNNRISYAFNDMRNKLMDDEAWADYKFKVNQENPNMNGTVAWGTMLEPQGSGVNKPSNKVPTEKTGLLNAKSPIEVISYSDKVIFSFSMEYYSPKYSARILDAKGKVLASLREQKDTAEIRVSSKPAKYYLELCEKEKGKSKYFYILLNIKATDIKPASSARAAQAEEYTRQDLAKITAVKEAYMRKHGIRNEDALTEKDWDAIAAELNAQSFADDDDDEEKGNLDTMPPEIRRVFQNYMKKHGISDIKNFTMDDWKAIQPELEGAAKSPAIKKKHK